MSTLKRPETEINLTQVGEGVYRMRVSNFPVPEVDLTEVNEPSNITDHLLLSSSWKLFEIWKCTQSIKVSFSGLGHNNLDPTPLQTSSGAYCDVSHFLYLPTAKLQTFPNVKRLALDKNVPPSVGKWLLLSTPNVHKVKLAGKMLCDFVLRKYSHFPLLSSVDLEFSLRDKTTLNLLAKLPSSVKRFDLKIALLAVNYYLCEPEWDAEFEKPLNSWLAKVAPVAERVKLYVKPHGCTHHVTHLFLPPMPKLTELTLQTTETFNVEFSKKDATGSFPMLKYLDVRHIVKGEVNWHMLKSFLSVSGTFDAATSIKFHWMYEKTSSKVDFRRYEFWPLRLLHAGNHVIRKFPKCRSDPFLREMHRRYGNRKGDYLESVARTWLKEPLTQYF